MILACPRLLDFALTSRSGLNVFCRENPRAAHRKATAFGGYPGRSFQEPLRGVLLRDVHNHLGSGSGGDFIGECEAHSLQLGQALERKEKRNPGSTRCLQHLSKPWISERREFIENDR